MARHAIITRCVYCLCYFDIKCLQKLFYSHKGAQSKNTGCQTSSNLPFMMGFLPAVWMLSVGVQTRQEGRKGWLREILVTGRKRSCPLTSATDILTTHNTQPWRSGGRAAHRQAEKDGDWMGPYIGKSNEFGTKADKRFCHWESNRRLKLGRLNWMGSHPSSADIWH